MDTPSLPLVVVLDDYQDVARTLADWTSLGCRVEFVHEHIADRHALAALLAHAAVIATLRERTRFDADLLAALPRLELLAASGSAGSQAFVDAAAATRLGIAVAISGDSREPDPSSTAELTMGLIVAVTRQIALGDRQLRSGIWQTHVGRRLHGKTLGLLGLGRIGGEVAKLAQAFAMRTIAWSRNLTAQKAAALGVQAVNRDELFTRSDVISVHLRLADATRGLVGAAELAQMQPDAYLVNTSRGPIIDEQALLHALRTRAIAGAALDVFDHEPLPAGHPFTQLDNVLLTPHVGYVVLEHLAEFYRFDVENIAAWLAGSPSRLLDPAAMQVSRERTAFGSRLV